MQYYYNIPSKRSIVHITAGLLYYLFYSPQMTVKSLPVMNILILLLEELYLYFLVI